MKLRIASAVLWFLAGWFLVGSIACRLGLNPAVGTPVGIAWAAFVMIDPKHLVWHDGEESAKATQGPAPHDAGARPQVGADLHAR